MGNKWEVNEWLETRLDEEDCYSYDYHLVYAGDSLLSAIAAMIKAKRRGAGCVKLEWRG